VRRALLMLLAGCSSFQDPDIVVDLRVIAMDATVPEQVVDVDLANPPQPTELLAQLTPSTVCALVADPGTARRLRYELTLCRFGDFHRCDPDVTVPLSSGIIEDPETGMVTATKMCATVENDGSLLGVILATLRGDALGGLGGIDYLVQLRVGGEDGDPALDLYASKTLRVAPRIPVAREANHNPSLARIEATLDGEPEPHELVIARCVDQTAPLIVKPGETVRLVPIETEGAREAYVVPTLDGKSRMFTESLTYQWSAGAGGFSSGDTGGPRDVAGNEAPLFTDWKAPRAEDLTGETDVALWIVQRDERLGVGWYESCIRVVP
jgi:hypothetical protein